MIHNNASGVMIAPSTDKIIVITVNNANVTIKNPYREIYKNTKNVGLRKITQTVGDLSVARCEFAATSVGSGSSEYALFGGGWDGDNNRTTVDVYDTSLIKSTPSALSIARSYLAATTIGSYALFGGGYDYIDTDMYYTAVDAYDVNLIHTTPNTLSKGRYELAATRVGEYALFAGGYELSDEGEETYCTIVDAYNKTLTRSTPITLLKGKVDLAGANIGEYALFAGGYDSDYNYSNIVDAYDTSLTRSTPTTLSKGRYMLASAVVGNYALFGGGYPDSGSSSKVVDAYDTSLTRSTPTAFSFARQKLAATSVGTGDTECALFTCGTTGSREVSSTDGYYSNLTRSTPTALSVARQYLAGTSVGNYALFGGGKYGWDKYFSTVEGYIASDGICTLTKFISKDYYYRIVSDVSIQPNYGPWSQGNDSTINMVLEFDQYIELICPSDLVYFV